LVWPKAPKSNIIKKELGVEYICTPFRGNTTKAQEYLKAIYQSNLVNANDFNKLQNFIKMCSESLKNTKTHRFNIDVCTVARSILILIRALKPIHISRTLFD
jgi:hypothetical protein